MIADGNKNRRCTRLTAAFLNRTRSYYALIEEDRVNDGFRITMNGDQGFHAMDIDPPPSEDDEDHNDDQSEEEENHADPDGPEDPDNGPPDDNLEEDQEDMEVENRFGNGAINEGGPQENGFHEGSANSTPPGSVARGNSPNSVLSFPSFTVLHDVQDMLHVHNLLVLAQSTVSLTSNRSISEEQSQDINAWDNFVHVISSVEPTILDSSLLSGNSNVLSREEPRVDVLSPDIGDLVVTDQGSQLNTSTMTNLPAWWRSWGFFCNAKTSLVQEDHDIDLESENVMVVREVIAESLATPEMEEGDAQFQLGEQAAQYFSRLLVAGEEVNSREKAIILSWPQLRGMPEQGVPRLTEYCHHTPSTNQSKTNQVPRNLARRTFKRKGMSLTARQAQQQRGRQMQKYQLELRTNGTLQPVHFNMAQSQQPHRTLDRLKRWKRQVALDKLKVSSDLLVGNEAKDTSIMAKRPREVTAGSAHQLARKAQCLEGHIGGLYLWPI
ncbi:OLC1v1036461C2 [Oldenlandia corymbosa var. corymbosa]|nr:OLC1v1036461C2 [Oldenlandia corymbosa var. corymbosa]